MFLTEFFGLIFLCYLLPSSKTFYLQPQQPGPESLSTPMSNLSVTQAGFNKLWVCLTNTSVLVSEVNSHPHVNAYYSIFLVAPQGQEHFDLLQSRNILPPEKVEEPKIRLNGFDQGVNCSPDIFRCTLTRIPETDSLLKKSRLPLGVLIHPFRDLAVSHAHYCCFLLSQIYSFFPLTP